jgi:glucose-1-phosphate thymidylyltransferase
MKAIIPVAGYGTRLRPHTHTVPKVLIQVAGKPILGHILEHVRSLGVKEVVLVVGYLGDKVREYVEENFDFRATFIHQEERKGLGHAIYLCRQSIGAEEPVLIVYGDTVFRADLSPLRTSTATMIGVKEVDDPRRFGVVELKGKDITRLVEKPAHPPSHLAVVGINYIRNPKLLFECLEELITREIRTKGEYQLTDALQRMIERGEVMRALPIEEWFDCGKPETLLSTNRALLDSRVGEYHIPGSIIIPPVYIAPSAKVEASVIGPYVSIAAGSVVRRSSLRDVIINENALVDTVLLHNSLIGDNAIVRGSYRKLNVGDSSEVDLT